MLFICDYLREGKSNGALDESSIQNLPEFIKSSLDKN